MRYLIRLPLVAMAAALVGCGGSPPAPKPGAEVVRLGYMPNVTHAAVLLGLFDPRGGYGNLAPGISVQGKAFGAGPSIVEALRAGALDAAVIGSGPAINAYWRGRDIVVLTNLVNGGSALVVRSGSGVSSVKDLAGRKVAVPQTGNTQDVLLRYQMADIGLRATDRGGEVSVQTIESANVLSLFRRGQLDAACVSEPWVSQLEREAGATVLLGPRELFNNGGYSAALLVARKDFVAKHPAAVRALVKATDSLTTKIAADPVAFAPALTADIRKASGRQIPERDIRRALTRCRFTSEMDSRSLRMFANLVEVAGYKKDLTASLDGILWK